MAGMNHNAGQMGQGGQTMNSTFGVAGPVHGMNAPMNSGMNAMGPGMNQPGMNHGYPMGKGQGQMQHGQHMPPMQPVQPTMAQGHGQWQQQHPGQDMHAPQHHPHHAPTMPQGGHLQQLKTVLLY